MTTDNFTTLIIGRMFIGTGIMGGLALVFIVLFYTIGQPFGTLNDIFVGLTAILSSGLAWILFSERHGQSGFPGQIALIAALVGAIIVVIGSVLVILGIKGWYLAGLYMATGNALIGLWVLQLSYTTLRDNNLPHSLVILGIISGLIMLLGLATIPGIIHAIDSWDSAPWYVNYIGQAGALGWLILYPIWCVLLGRAFLLKS